MERKRIDLSTMVGKDEEFELVFPNGQKCIMNKGAKPQDPFDLVPKSWEECCEKLSYEFDDERAYCNLSGLCPVRDIDAFIAMFKLRRLWYEWVKVLGEPKQETSWDSEDDFSMNWAITTSGAGEDGLPTYEATFQTKCCLLFREDSHAEKFIECFPKLLEQAKILL